MRPKSFLVISIYLVCFFPLNNVWASDLTINEKDQQELHEMHEIVVTATRVKQSKQDIAANITVISHKDIENLPVSSVGDVLQYIPGIDVEFNGGPGSQSTARIQGSELRHVAVFQDGVPLNQLANPMTDLSQISVDAVDRIEIYKGAASSAWGSGLGGVINIITKEPDPNRPFAADIRTSYGESHTVKSRGTVSGTVDRFGYLLSAKHDETDGFIDNSESTQDSVYAKIRQRLGETTDLGFIFSFSESETADPLPTYSDFWDDVDQKRIYQQISLNMYPSDDLHFTLEGRHHTYENHTDDVYILTGVRDVWNDYEDEIWGLSSRLSWETADVNTLNIGFDGDWGEYDWHKYTETYDTDNWAIYANDTFTAGNFVYNVGIRSDDNDIFGNEISPSCGVVYHISENRALIRAQVAKGFSAPPPSWLHDPRTGNPDLEPEVAVNYQLGTEIIPFSFLRFEFNLFYADVKDLINFVPADPQTIDNPGRFENIDKVVRKGVEGNITLTFEQGLKLIFGGSFVDVEDKDTHEEIKDIPRVKQNISAVYTYKWMTHTLNGKFIDNNSSYPETKDRKFVFDYYFKAKLMRISKTVQPSIYFAVYNLFDSDYIYREDFPQPDRWAEGGVRLEF